MQDARASEQEGNPLVEFGRMDEWADLARDIRRLRGLLRDGLSPKEAMSAFRSEASPASTSNRTRAA